MTADKPPFPDVLDGLLDGKDLALGEAEALMDRLMDGAFTEAQMAGLLVALRAKGATADEIAGFATAMRDAAVPVKPTTDRPLVDTCGTGGASARTFSVSTAAAFVVAAAGAAVAKHGNRSHSSPCGSADLVEALGAPLELGPTDVARLIDETGVGFMYAPAFHPAMKRVVPVRRALGVRTVFNLLGPLTNPARVRRQVLGVYDPALIDRMAGALSAMGHERALVVHGHPGMDEVSVAGPTDVARVEDGRVERSTVTPDDLGLSKARSRDLGPLAPDATAKAVRDLFSGFRGPRRDFLLANAGFGIVAAGLAETPAEGVEAARQVLDDGGALDRLEAFVEAAREAKARRDAATERARDRSGGGDGG